jgi:hypothetical protein
VVWAEFIQLGYTPTLENSNFLGTLLIVDTLDDKLLEFNIELLPHILRSDDHYQNLPLL